jgi:hypothetical protein
MPAPRRQHLLARLRHKGRAFALPLVVLLLLVGGLAVGLLMERHGVSYRAIVRNVDNYKNHHRSAGIKECILRWLDTARGHVDQSLDADGLAFTMDVSGEGHIDVYLRDAQGSSLSDPSSLSGRRREIVEDMKFLLETIPVDQRPDNLFRPVGPPEICLNTAPDLLVKALCLAIVGEPNKATQAATAVLDRKATVRPTGTGANNPTNIADALRDVPITERQRREIASMLVTQPSLYECLVETRNSSGALLNRSSGLYHLDESRSDTFKQGGGFLTWDSLPLEDSRIAQ